MGNSTAYPVFRTTDPAEAHARAEWLRALLAHCEDEVGLSAELLTAADVRRMAEVLPGARFHYMDARTGPEGEYLRFDLDPRTAEDAALEPHLPLDVQVNAPAGSVEERFAAAVGRGRGMAAVDWHGRWPDDPETGSVGSPKYDGVQIVFHGDQAQWGGRTEHHTVFVHVSKFGDEHRARKLAAAIGGEVLGEAQLGW
ncbi:hypothetical protein [Kitasatospora sp. MBT66]|uniref:hypothetical protein n=1 Tax=Kitasatospora sp. MBT66 TaxID=1444769 RepID=UPI0005BDA68F|nr:hypothetical protein [Kitasatospora sp. MBT66]